MKIETKAIHAGHVHDKQYGSLTTPLYQTSTFVFDSAEQGGRRFAGEEEGYIYTRLGNPTTRELEKKVAALENMEDAAATATGMAAVSAAILANIEKDQHIIASKALYGCTFAFLSHMLPKFGVEVTFVDFTNPGEWSDAIQDNTKMLFVESPINPNMQVIDLEAVGNFAKQHNLLAICDNTFMTPILQQPVNFGFDIVIHSATKYLNGHGDVVAGIVCGTAEMIENVKLTALKDIGGTMSPHDAWLILRGLKTLPIRVERHCENAQKLAEFLDQHELVEKVYYPGLKSHQGNAFIGKQMKAAGGVIAFELKGDKQDGINMLNETQLFQIAVSLGDAESLIQHPASMTHSPYSDEERQKAGISDNLIRISAGLENVDDLIEDLNNALYRAVFKSQKKSISESNLSETV